MDLPTSVANLARRLLARRLAPRRDRAMRRPPELAHGLGEVPPAGQAAALAAQQIATQSIYLILPGLVAAEFGLVTLEIVNFLALSVAAIGIAALLQVTLSGPVGSGYPVPSIPSPVFAAVYLLAAPGASLEAVAALTVLAGLLGALLSLTLRRLAAILPAEVAGVVIFLIGVSLLPRAFAAGGEVAVPGDAAGVGAGGLLALATLALMIGVALTGGRFARFAVLAGAAAGTLGAMLLGIGMPADTSLLAEAPWFALPRPALPAPSAIQVELLPAFGVALLASLASWVGDLVAFQRAADAGWRRPDAPPLRRGLLAQSLALVLAGGIGGMAPSTSSACVGLAIATGTLARRIAVLGAGALLLLACCPKALALVVLLPEPVEAAMLGYVCCFMLASGCALMTSRMLDARRTFTVGIGIATGLGVLLDQALFGGPLRVLASPVVAGAAAAILLNLLTVRLVARRAGFALEPGPLMTREIDARMEALGGAWGARRETVARAGHALLEVAEVLALRGAACIEVTARHADDRLLLDITWLGQTLPRPSPRPDVLDLEGPNDAQEAFALWLATREAETVEQRSVDDRCELRLAFSD